MHTFDCRRQVQGKPPVHLNPPDWSWQAMLATAKSLGGKVAREANPDSKEALKQQLAQLKADMEQAKTFKPEQEPKDTGYPSWKSQVETIWTDNNNMHKASTIQLMFACMHCI